MTGGDDIPDFTKSSTIEAWLKDKPREWSILIASRAALSALALSRAASNDENFLHADMLLSLRSMAIGWFTASCPKYNREAASAAYAATRATHDRYNLNDLDNSIKAADAAARASYGAPEFITTDAAFAVFAARFTYTFATEDAQALNHGIASHIVARQGLWKTKKGPWGSWAARPSFFDKYWVNLKRAMLIHDATWQVWIDWYEDVLAGRWRGEDHAAAFTDLPGVLPWDDGPKAVNSEIARRLTALSLPEPAAERISLERLADLASPQPFINEKGQFDVGPNKIYDASDHSEELASLPARQIALIALIVDELPGNTPKLVAKNLRAYARHLKQRGVEPILGILKDAHDMIEAELGDRAAREWFSDGQKKGFERFSDNHLLLCSHYPLDKKREEIFAAIPIDAATIDSTLISQNLSKLKEAAEAARQDGKATEDFVEAVSGMAETWANMPSAPVLGESHVRDARADHRKRAFLSTASFLSALSWLSTEGGKAAILEFFKQPVKPVLDYLLKNWPF